MNSSPIVVDASAAIALLRGEPARTALSGVLDTAAHDGARLLAPDVFWLEVANVLVRRHRLPPGEVVEALRSTDELGIVTVSVDRPLLLVAIDLLSRFGLSAYDAAYLALAETEDGRLLTLDRGLAAAAGPRAIPLPGIRQDQISDQPATYGEPIDWAQFGPYLARLRAEARAGPRPD